MSLTYRPSLALLGILGLGCIGPTAVVCQAPIRVGVAAQVISFDAPLAGYAGVGLVGSAGIGLGRWLSARLDGDFAAVQEGDRVTVCIIVPGGCLTQPSSQSLAGVTAMLEIHAPPGAVSPFFAAGPGYRLVLGAVGSGGQRSWVQPSVETGARFGGGTLSWNAGIRWRRVAAWKDQEPSSELGLFVGFRLQ